MVLSSQLALAQESVSVLPKGISRFRVVGVVTDTVSQTFNDKGEVANISSSLNRSVTVNDFVAQSPQLGALVDALNALQAGLGNNLANANLYNDFSQQVQIYMPAYEYGVTSRFSLGIRAPIVKRTIKNNFRVSSINNADAINAQLGNINPDITAGLVTVGANSFDTAFFQNALFTSKGYATPKNYSKTELGDVEFGGKFRLQENDTFTTTGLLGFRAPTGSQPDLYDVFNPGNSKGAWAVGLQGLEQIQLAQPLSVLAAAKIIYNLPDTRRRAVPKDANDTLPSVLPQGGQVHDITRKRGTELESELSATYKFANDSFGIWAAHQFNAKEADKFTGPSGLYYDGLSRNTKTFSHASEAGVNYSTIPAFRKNKFAVPMEVSLLYNKPMAGKNTPLVPYSRMDLMIYF